MNCATELRDAVKRDLTAEVIRRFGEARLKVTGASMLPSLWPGDEIAVRRQSAAGLSAGQVVLGYRNQAFVAHRVVAIRDGAVVTRGDALAYEDAPFREDEVLGVVVSIMRRGRRVGLSPAWWQRVTSWMVQGSELCTKVLLRLQRLEWAD
jgi:signal peptidase I